MNVACTVSNLSTFMSKIIKEYKMVSKQKELRTTQIWEWSVVSQTKGRT